MSNLTNIQEQIDYFASNGGGKVRLREGNIAIDGPIELKPKVSLETGPGSKIVASGDHDLLHVHQGATIYQCHLDCSGVAGYSSDALKIHSADVPEVFEQTAMRNVFIDGLGGTDNRTPRGGRGVVLLAEDDAKGGVNQSAGFVTGVLLDGFHIQGFDESIHIESVQNGTDIAFVNSNTFRNGLIDWYKTAIRVIGDNASPIQVTGNRFTNIHFQTRPDSEIVLDADGGAQNECTEWKLWDWGSKHNPDGADDASGPALRLKSDCFRWHIAYAGGTPSDLLDDRGFENRVYNRERFEETAGKYFVGPMQLDSTSFTPSDDLLYAADRKDGWVVRQTSGTDPVNATDIANIFDHRATVGAEWDATSTYPVVIEVYMGRERNNIKNITADFLAGRIPQEVKIELHDADTDTWITVVERPWRWDDAANTLIQSNTENHDRISTDVDFADQDGKDKLRITLDGGPVGTNDKVELSGLYAFNIEEVNKAVVGRRGGVQNRVAGTLVADSLSAFKPDNHFGDSDPIADYPNGMCFFEVRPRPQYSVAAVVEATEDNIFTDVTAVILEGDHTIARRLSVGDDFDIIVNNSLHNDNSVSALSYDASKDRTTVTLNTQVDLEGEWNDPADSVEAEYADGSAWPQTFGFVRTHRARFSDQRSAQWFIPNANTDDRHRVHLRRWDNTAGAWTEWRVQLVNRHGSSLPATNLYDGELFYHTGENLLYVFNETAGAWEYVGPAADTTGDGTADLTGIKEIHPSNTVTAKGFTNPSSGVLQLDMQRNITLEDTTDTVFLNNPDTIHFADGLDLSYIDGGEGAQVNVPTASNTEQGIARLYNSAGSATDGAVTQALFSTHAARHHDGGGDEISANVLDAGGSVDGDAVLSPDGSGSTRWQVLSHSQLQSVAPDDHHAKYTDEEVRDVVAAFLVGGTNVTLAHDDPGNTLTIDASGGSSYTDEDAQDAVGAMVDSTLSYVDATPSLGVVEGNLTHDNLAGGTATDAHHARDHAGRHNAGGADEVTVDTLGVTGTPNTNAALRPDGTGSTRWALVDHAELAGVGVNDHHARDHQARHHNGGADELDVGLLAATPTNTDAVLSPDGAGGVSFQVLAHSQLQSVGSSDHHVRYSDEEVRDVVAAFLVGGTNVTLTHDDAGNTLTIDASGGSSYTDEDAQDAVGAMVDSTLSYVDSTPSLGVVESNLTHDNLSGGTASSAHHTRYSNEEAQDAIGAMVDSTLSYNDATPSLGVVESNLTHDNLSGGTATNAHHNRDHASRHHQGNADEIDVQLLASGAVTDTAAFVHADGSGGLSFKKPLGPVSKLTQSISSPPTQTEVQNIQSKVNDIIQEIGR